MSMLDEWRDQMRQEEERRRATSVWASAVQQEFSKAGVLTSDDARETAFHADRWLRRQLTHPR